MRHFCFISLCFHELFYFVAKRADSILHLGLVFSIYKENKNKIAFHFFFFLIKIIYNYSILKLHALSAFGILRTTVIAKYRLFFCLILIVSNQRCTSSGTNGNGTKKKERSHFFLRISYVSQKKI